MKRKIKTPFYKHPAFVEHWIINITEKQHGQTILLRSSWGSNMKSKINVKLKALI